MEWIAKYHFEDQKLCKAMEKIEVKYLENTDGLIAVSTYTQIMENTFQVIKEEFWKIDLESKAKRRLLMKDIPKYFAAIMECFMNVAELIREGIKAVADKAGISAQKFKDSKIKLKENGHDFILTLQE